MLIQQSGQISLYVSGSGVIYWDCFRGQSPGEPVPDERGADPKLVAYRIQYPLLGHSRDENPSFAHLPMDLRDLFRKGLATVLKVEGHTLLDNGEYVSRYQLLSSNARFFLRP